MVEIGLVVFVLAIMAWELYAGATMPTQQEQHKHVRCNAAHQCGWSCVLAEGHDGMHQGKSFRYIATGEICFFSWSQTNDMHWAYMAFRANNAAPVRTHEEE